jgi:hypothetical protein
VLPPPNSFGSQANGMSANQSDRSFGSGTTTAQARRRKALDMRAKLNERVPRAFRGCRYSSFNNNEMASADDDSMTHKTNDVRR